MKKSFAFKLLIIIWSWIKTAAILFPICYLLVSVKQGKLKYGYDFFEVDWRWALMISIGVAMVFVVWTAMEFSRLNFSDLKQYLKSRQKHYYNYQSEADVSEVKSLLESFASANRRWTSSSSIDGFILSKKNPYFIKDRLTITWIEGGLEIEAKPIGMTFLPDMGRNFKHILKLGDYLKERGV